jgi:hypothetical protein
MDPTARPAILMGRHCLHNLWHHGYLCNLQLVQQPQEFLMRLNFQYNLWAQ